MNIVFNNDSLEVQTIDASGGFFQVVDKIGFANADGEEGFNRISTSYVYQNEPNPQLSDYALVLYAYLNRSKDSLPTIPVNINGENTREDSDEQDYNKVAFKFNVEIVDDGWYTIYGFLLPVNTNSGIYFNKTTKKVMDASSGDEVAVQSLIDKQGILSAKIEKFITVGIERKLYDYIGMLADIGVVKGYNDKDYLSLQQKILFIDAQLMGSIIKFNDGYTYKAQETLENLKNSFPFMKLK